MTLVYYIFRSFQFLIFIRVILSWFRLERGNSFSDFVYDFTEPLLSRLRIVLPMGGMGLDLSPILAIFLIDLVMNIVLRLLFTYSIGGL